MSVLAFDCRNSMVSAAWSAKCNPTDSAMEGALAIENGHKVVTLGLKMTFLDVRHRSSAVRLLNAERPNEIAGRPMRVIQIICRDDQAVGQAEEITLSRIKNMSIAMLRTDRSLLFVIKAVLN